MASTTNAKKEIIDFLWEWGEPKGDWAKLLIDKIVKTEAPLSTADRQEVFDYFIDSLRTNKKLPVLTIKKPVFTATSKDIKLTSLSNVTGVNRLAKNQKMVFANNLTVIYGENGTGKTGYGRILKSLGFSYEQSTIIHHNVFGATEAKSALVGFTVNGTAKSFTWSGANTEEDLSNISVFNNNCVQISLSDRKLIVSPIGFHFFDLVSGELSELTALLTQKKAGYSTILLCAGILHEGTPQHKFISELSDKSTDQQLKALSEFPSDLSTAIAAKEKEHKGLNQELLITQISNLTNQITELRTHVTRIRNTQGTFTLTEWNTLIKFNEEIATLEGKTKLGIKDIAEANGIQFFETQQFKDFLSSADQYIKLLSQPYPKVGDNCAYCNQPLEEPAQKLLQSYKNLLNDTTENELKKLVQSRETLIRKIKEIEATSILNHASFGLDEASKIIQPSELTAFNKQLKEHKDQVVNNTITKELKFDIDYEGLLKIFEEKQKALEETLKHKQEALLTISEKVLKLENEIKELQDRKVLAENEADIKKAILNHRSLKLLNSKANDFGTNAISRKTTEAREELVSQDFDDLFKKELKAFGKGHLKVDLNFGTDKGKSKIIQKINQYQLTEILSEGEQKAIALAEFLTELQLDKSNAPVIFDDPVNSLDHHIIDEAAKRLISLSKERQVVIFTHSVLLFNSLLFTSSQSLGKGVACKFLNTRNEYQETGFISDAEEINTVKSVIKTIEALSINIPSGRTEADVAGEAYGHLRAAIELCVEHEILNGTVKRYQKNIALSSFAKIKIQPLTENQKKLNDIFEKCCGFIIGHSNPTEVVQSPTMVGFKADFEEFKAIRQIFLN